MSTKKSLRADKTPPRKTTSVKQMVDIKGFPLSTEQGNPLVTEKAAYRKSEYGQVSAPSVVVNSDSYKNEGLSSKNQFSKGSPAALPIVEQFAEQSEVSRSLLGIDRATTQQGLFGNVSTYGLDPKDWKIDSYGYDDNSTMWWWSRRPSSTGNYYPVKYIEDSTNAAIALTSNPTPFLEPPKPSVQGQLTNPGGSTYQTWGQYVNSLVAQYLMVYMVENFTRQQWEQFNLIPMLTKYVPIDNGDGTYSFNELYWDKLWLDIQQNRFGSDSSTYPIIPNGKAFNFRDAEIENWRQNASLWGTNNVFITEANQNLTNDLDVSWDKFFFSTTRVYYPTGRPEDKGHFRIKTNPVREVWEKYHGLRWDELRQDLKNWEFTVHPNESTVTQLEKDLKLPYFVLDTPIVPDKINNTFSNLWPSASFGAQINLPTDTNRIGGTQGINSEITLKSIRSFRYQPGRISGFTYGVKVSEVGAGPGTIIEFGIENDSDAYMFMLKDGALFSIVRRSIVPLENNEFFDNARYGENTTEVIRNGVVQYETVIEQKNMNGDPLSGEGETGYLINPDTVTMYKIEFGWYGAIGARFYVYVPTGNGDCRWVTLHTLVIENQLGRPCLGDPFFYFKYRLKVQDSSAIRIDQYIYKFGASYYIDGYDEGTLYSLNAQSRVRHLSSPNLSLSKTQLNAIDWTTLMGIKPRTFLVNRYGNEFYNKKEIFPQDLQVYSEKDCEIKIIRQKGCPEWAFSHQEGYYWAPLPTERRLKAKFNVVPYFELDSAGLGISANDAGTYTAVASYNDISTDGVYRDPTDSDNWSVIGNQTVRLVGDDLFGLYISRSQGKDFSSGLSIKLKRDDYQETYYLSSRKQFPRGNNVYLPFTYPLIGEYANGYDIEFDYYRRDQTLLSTVDIISDEFFLYWVGGSLGGLDASHSSGYRIGFVWPELTDTNHPLHKDKPDWGTEADAIYDGQAFHEGLPYDFPFQFKENCLYVETHATATTDTYNLEVGEYTDFYYTDIDYSQSRLSVPGTDGGTCRALGFKAGRELRENVTIIAEPDEALGITNYYVSDTSAPWPNLSPESFQVTLSQGNVTANWTTTGGIVRQTEDVVQYLLPLGESLPSGISPGEVKVSYSVIYIATLNKRSEVQSILVSNIAPGNVPFMRMFIQGRQGATMGGVWIGQKISNGMKVDPFTPHRCSVSISDDGNLDRHGQYADTPLLGGATKVIGTFTHIDNLGGSTAPTINPNVTDLDTRKSIHTSPKKCGSFLAKSGTNSAGIFTPSDYPIRWLTSNEGTPLATYYVSANTPTKIDLTPVFNMAAESIVNEDDGNLATFFIGRALDNFDDTVDNPRNEIYLSLNYTEQ